MKKYLNKVMIVDGSYFLHRALHTPGLSELVTSEGVKSGGVYGTLRILQSELKKFPGYFPIFCFDKGLSSRRVNLYPDYKSNRSRIEADSLIANGVKSEQEIYLEEYHRQRADLIEILKSLGIPSLLLPGWEGDDLQYLLSTVCKEGVVVSDDKDMIQLVAPNIIIRRSMRDEVITYGSSSGYYEYPRFVIRKAIVGDPSDNLPKCAQGVGEKGADKIAQVIEQFSFDEYKSVLENHAKDDASSLSKKIVKLLDNWDQFVINYKLTDLRLVEAPPGFESMIKDLITLVVGHSNIMKAYSLLGKYELNSIYPDQIIAMLAVSSSQLLIKE